MSSYKVLAYRGADLPDEYRGILFAGWLRSFRHGNDYFRLVVPDKYYKTYHRYISTILENPETTVRLAVLSDDKDVVLGFSVSRGGILDYVYVNKDQRRQGIAKSLLPPEVDTITHLTKTALTIWGSKYGDWKFNPFA